MDNEMLHHELFILAGRKNCGRGGAFTVSVSRDEQDDTRSKRVRMAADAIGCTLGRRGKPWDEEWQEVEQQCKDHDGFRFRSLKQSAVRSANSPCRSPWSQA